MPWTLHLIVSSIIVVMTNPIEAAFELLNESLVYLGTGIFGLFNVTTRGSLQEIMMYAGITTAAATVILCYVNAREQRKVDANKVVLITGCDSGLGYNIALKCHALNMTVVAACHNECSEGARQLQQKCSKRLRVIELDITKKESVMQAHKFVRNMLADDHQLTFDTLVNNAGVMCFGEFEWQTDDIVEQQIGVNLLGHMRVTKEFLPLIRKHRGRIVNVTSHCALKALPGLAPYAASKVALSFWTESLRMELKKYKVDVVNFIPGSYVTCTNISSRQTEYAQEMRKSMTAEQLDFYGDYFDEYNSYLKVISGYKAPVEIDDKGLMLKFERALRDEEPMKVYIHEPYRYKLYHTLFKICPTFISDWLVDKFLQMPQYRKDADTNKLE